MRACRKEVGLVATDPDAVGTGAAVVGPAGPAERAADPSGYVPLFGVKRLPRRAPGGTFGGATGVGPRLRPVTAETPVDADLVTGTLAEGEAEERDVVLDPERGTSGSEGWAPAAALTG
jgi:hypothetical protein